MIKLIQFAAGLLLLISIELLKTQQTPESTQSDAITFITTNLHYLRLIGVLMIFYPVIYYFKFGNRASQYSIGAALVTYLIIFVVKNKGM
jgi:hypothetical protein